MDALRARSGPSYSIRWRDAHEKTTTVTVARVYVPTPHTANSPLGSTISDFNSISSIPWNDLRRNLTRSALLVKFLLMRARVYCEGRVST